ncbi:MAG TPA: CHAD domain-containing protein [Lysobacter sp.]
MPHAADRHRHREPDAPFGLRLRDHAASELDSAIAHLGWRGSRVHAGVHLARKALRRVRATIALDGDALGPGAALVDRELRRLNRGLSQLRDAQALVETLDRLIAAGHDAATMQLLHRGRRRAASHRAGCARESLAADPELRQRRALLTTLRGALLALPWELPDATQLQANLAASEHRMQQARAKADRVGDDEDWHRWRRRARRVSQQLRALNAAGIAIAEATTFDKHATERLGAAQDLALLLEHCGRRSPFSKADRAALRRFAEPELARRREHLARA